MIPSIASREKWPQDESWRDDLGPVLKFISETSSVCLLQKDLSHILLPSVWELAFPRTCLSLKKIFLVFSHSSIIFMPFLKILFFKSLYMGVLPACKSMHVCVCVCAVSKQVRGKHWTLRNLSYRQLLTVIWVPRTKSGSPARVTSVQKHCTLSPALQE